MPDLHLGDLRVTGLTDHEQFDVDLATIFPDAVPEAIAGIDWIATDVISDGILHLKIRSWLLRIGGRNILIDTCVGAHKDRPLRPNWHMNEGKEWTAALAAAGLDPDDIDLVMCTHLHADHVGWNTRLENGRWVPTFPNARYVCAQTEYAFWEAESAAGRERHGCFPDSVLPIMQAGRMDLVDDGWDLGPGLTLAASPGHTPGHMCVHAAHGGGAVFSGDAIHSPVQLAFPDWSSAFCADGDQARTTRHALLNEVVENGSLLIPAHFADPGWIRIRRHGASFAPATE